MYYVYCIYYSLYFMDTTYIKQEWFSFQKKKTKQSRIFHKLHRSRQSEFGEKNTI